MPVIRKECRNKIHGELQARFAALISQVATRELINNREGAGKYHWVNPDERCCTIGGAMDVRLAVDDFKAILAEVRKLK